MANPTVDEILRKHPELSLAEAQWMAGETLAPSERVTVFDEKLLRLLDEMFAAMHKANGVGLAAPQIGRNEQVAIIDLDGVQAVLINPAIFKREGMQRDYEGCLSLPEFREKVTRPAYVKVRAQNTQGDYFEMEAEGLLARAICHEVDHLKGQLFIKHISCLKRDLIRRKIKKLTKAGLW